MRLLTKSSTQSTTAATLLFLTLSSFAIIGIRTIVVAQSPIATSVQPLYRVLFPVNEKGEPASKYVYVPSLMYDLLVQASESQKPASDKWLLTSALYSGDLAPQSVDAPLSIQRITCTMGFETFRPGLTISLPVADVDNFDGKVQLDGQPAEWEWNQQRSAILFRAGQSGTHRLQYSQRLAAGSVQSGYGFDCPVLPIPNSRLELTATRESQLTVTTAIGESQTSDDSRRSVFTLGPISLARVRWRPAESANGVASLPIRTRAWMQVAPGVVRGEARYSHRDGLPVRQLRISVPPGIRPLPVANNRAAPHQELVEQSLDRRTYLLTQNGDRPFLTFHFVLSDTTGVGEMSLPEIKVENAELADTQWAFTIAEGLSFERIVGRATPSLSPLEFAEQWGGGRTPPNFALAIRDTEFPWALKTYPRQSSSLAESATDIYYSSDKIRLEFKSLISPIEGDSYQRRLKVPKGLRNVGLTILQDGKPQDVNWSIDENEVLHAFPSKALSGPHRIRLTGSLIPETGENQIVPIVRVADSTTTSEEFHIYRDSSVRLQLLNDGSELQTITNRSTSLPTDDWHLVESLLSSLDELPRMRVRVTPDQTAVRGRMLIELREDLDGWWADVDYRVQFDNGTPDTITFNIPQNWGESLQTEPSVLTTLEDLPGGRRRLTVRPDLPADAAEYRLKIFGPLKGAQGVEVPRIMPVRQPYVLRWLSIPTRIRGQVVAWNYQKLMPTKAPPEFKRDSENRRIFRMTDADAGASLLRVEAAPSAPRILLQDVTVTVDESGFAGRVVYDLEPNGTQSTQLEIPAGTEVSEWLWERLGHPRVLKALAQLLRLR